MPENRQPCSICEAQILVSTSERNRGLCGQCAKDPDRARQNRYIRDLVSSFGDPTEGNFARQLEQSIQAAISTAKNIYGEDELAAIFLYGIAHVYSPEFIAVSKYDLSLLSNTIWDHDQGWGGLGSRINEDIFYALHDFRHKITEEFDVRTLTEDILMKVREENLLPKHTFICIVDEGDGYDEFIETASKFNHLKTLQQHENWTRNPY
jgi:hypothetical protein